MARVTVIIPALNEVRALPNVLADLPGELVSEVIVCDNGSTDGTPEAAIQAGARVVIEPQRGYGAACLAGLRAIESDIAKGIPAPDIVAFIDGDYSDFPEEMRAVLAPILAGRADFVVGSRVLGERERGALTPQQRAGNLLAVALLRAIYRVRFTDLGPFRAIRWPALRAMNMRDENFGWTVEMQIKAARMGLKSAEVPVRYRKRIGQSKISGTIKGTILAGTIILKTIATYAGRRVRATPGGAEIGTASGSRSGTERSCRSDFVAQTFLSVRAGESLPAPPAQTGMSVPHHAQAERGSRSGSEGGAISAIVPTLNEAAQIGECLAALVTAGIGAVAGDEIIVCDGGSSDDTLARVRQFAATLAVRDFQVRTVTAERGRAAQMNAGAAVATNAVLWFVHADCRAEGGTAAAIRAAMKSATVIGGACRFRLPGRSLVARAIEFGVRVRSEFFGLPYGDQGLFVRRAMFASLGGFPGVPIMEDVLFLRRLRHRGRGRFVNLPIPLVTSDRRWRRLGVLRTTAINAALMALLVSGAGLPTLARLYGRSRGVRG